MKRERSKRIPYEKLVDFGPRNPSIHAITTDISDTGLHIQTDKVYRHGTNLHITIHSGKEEYYCEGVVSWSKVNSRAQEDGNTSGMGIRFSKLPKKLLRKYKEWLFSGFTCLTPE